MVSPRHGINVVFSQEAVPNLRSVFLICGFPGSGFVGKLAVDHLIQELKAKHLADIYSTSFPPQILIRTDGTADLIKNSIFYFEDTGPDPISLLLLTGDSQPANSDSEYLLAEEILDLAARFNPRQVFTLAAYITGVFIDKPRIFGTATDVDIVKTFQEKGVLAMDSGSITGMNGIVIGIAKMRGLKGVCLLGETSGYVVDAKSSKSLLETLLSMIGLKVDMKNLEKRAKDTETLIQTLEQQLGNRTGRILEGNPPSTQNRPSNTGYIS
ncbi:MAG TPA: proteasome assembly chaperone family protein [Nitrososphaeraceae archaeon]|nr:proteasome assembly chaperone family protein [Nitrososphaeraceae archaeon]